MSIFSQLKSPEVLFESSSKYNPDIKIIRVGNTIRLAVNGFIQSVNYDSPVCKKLFLGKTIDLLKREFPDAKKVLILGLGGGTMARLVSLNFKDSQIVSVDIDPQMVEIGKKFFDIDSIPNHRIILDDAMRVVVEPDKNDLDEHEFDAAIVDIFVGNTSPDLVKTGNFISHLKKLVRPGGIIIFNRNYTTDFQEEANIFTESLGNYLKSVKTEVVAGYTNSDNVLIYGRV